MTLKVNAMYKTNDGHIIPRSRFGDDMPKYAIVEVVTGDNSHFVMSHKTFTKKDFRKALNLDAKEKVEII